MDKADGEEVRGLFTRQIEEGYGLDGREGRGADGAIIERGRHCEFF